MVCLVRPALALGLLVVCAPVSISGSETPDAVDALLGKVDPANDDWSGEIFQTRAAAQLEALAEYLRQGASNPQGLAALVSQEARSTHLRPKSLRENRLAGGIRVARMDGSRGAGKPRREPGPALADLIAPLRAASGLRFGFKIVGVDLHAGPRPVTEVRYEAAGFGERTVQQTARWQVSWLAVDPPRIAEIRLLAFEQVWREAPLFSDCTGSVLAAGAGPFELLRWGGESWHGRVDTVAGLHLMGHHGIAVGDANGDGLEDLYVALGAALPNMLLIQQTDGTVEDRALEAGVAWLDDTKGTLFADVDNDGDQDLLVAIGPTIVISFNDGKGTFDRVSSLRAGSPAAFYSLSVADYDLDGDLDIFGARYVRRRYGVSVPEPFHDARNGPPNHLLRNEGEGRFVDVTHEVGLDVGNDRFSLIGAWADYDEDGDPDLYVANDFGRNNLYRNDAGRFVDVAAAAGVQDQAAGMGASWADYDRDGDLDLHVTNMYSAAGNRVAHQPRFRRGLDVQTREQIRRHAIGNTLLANQGDGTFRDVSDVAGIRMGRWGWGGRFVDLNNDGADDLVVPNGFLTGAIEDDL